MRERPQKETALVICPGRGTYNTAELGYLKKYHGGGGAFVARLDAMRIAAGQVPISVLDNADTFSPSQHMTGDNASLLIYACAMLDFAAINRDRYDVIAVTGNSMGWYLSLACACVLNLDAGAALVNTMGTLMHAHGTGGQGAGGQGVGGQVVWSLMDDDWRIDAGKQALADDIITQAAQNPDIAVHVSIRLGGMIVFAANEEGLKWLLQKLPKDDRFPMRLNYHAAFHSPLLDHMIPIAKAANAQSDFGGGAVPLIDGTGRIWSPKAYDLAAIYAYTLGAQINRTYNFSRAVQIAAAEFAPDKIIILGPGTTLGAPVAQALIASGWRGLSGKADFAERQKSEPFLLSMGIKDQRSIATGIVTG